jgi:hypothetical protein
MGLSPWGKYDNIFDLAYRSGEINSRLFGFNMSGSDSYLLYNNFHPEAMKKVTWLQSESEFRWQLKIIGFYMNGHDETSHLRSYTKALLYSSSTCLAVNQDMLTRLYNRFLYPNKNCTLLDGAYYCTCERGVDYSAYFPNITIYLRGVIIQVPYTNYLIYHSLNKCSFCITVTTSDYVVLG